LHTINCINRDYFDFQEECLLKMSKKKGNATHYIIKKNIIIKGGGHHGGAWKVAYADFVTAMMAFFLLLWLLNSTPSQKLQGIAQYFEPTMGIMNKKSLDKESNSVAKSEEETASEGQSVTGVVFGVKKRGDIWSSEDTDGISSNDQFQLIQEKINEQLADDPRLREVADQISFEQSAEGLLIEIRDSDKKEMFQKDSAALSKEVKMIIDKVVAIIRYLPNFIAIGGHTERIGRNEMGEYTAWELSADRANTARRYMLSEGIATDRIAKVTAYADSVPANTSDPYAPNNRRISFMILNNASGVADYKISAPRNLKNMN